MSYATAILYLNMGGEMLYVLQQRLNAQRICFDKRIQVMNEVIRAFLNPKQLQFIFDKSSRMHMRSLRTILEQVVLSSIMKLDSDSMNKLFDLMMMMVKYQLDTVTGPRELILLTFNHLDAVRHMVVENTLHINIDLAYQLILSTFGNMSHKEIWQVRNDCLGVFEDCKTRVSILLRLGLQNEDATFNRMTQRYNEQYQEKQETLGNIQLLEYSADENSMGSLLSTGSRVTLLGKNLYSSIFEQMKHNSSTENLHEVVTISDEAAKQDLEALATELGKEETMSHRPISLHLFTNDERNFNCNSGKLKVNSFNTNSDVTDITAEKENLSDMNQSFIEYKNKLLNDINSDFSDNEEAGSEAMDLMNMLNIL